MTNLTDLYYIPFDRYESDLGTDLLSMAMTHMGTNDPDYVDAQDMALHMMFDYLRSMGEDPMATMVEYLRPAFV